MIPPRAPAPSDRRPDLRTGLMVAVTVILVGWALQALAVVLMPLAAAVLIGLGVMPVRDRVRAGVPPWLGWLGVAAAMGVVLLALLAFFGGLALAGQQLAGKVPEAADAITGMLEAPPEAGRTVAEGAEAGAAEEAQDQEGAAAPAGAAGTQATGTEGAAQGGRPGPPSLASPREALRQGSEQLLGAAGGAAQVLLGSAVSILANLVLIFFLTLLLLLESGDWARKALRVAGRRAEWRMTESAEVVAHKFRAYVLLQAGFGLATATLYAVWLGLWGVDLILVWALLSFLMNFIPNLGSIVSGGVATAYALATKDWGTGIAVGAGILAIEQVIGNVVAPRLQGRNIALSPLVILVGLVFWTWAWGVAGALLAVPLTFALVVVMAHVPALRPWALLLTDQTDWEGLEEATTPGGS